MGKKTKILIGIAVVLAAVYVIYFTTWFTPKTVGIFHTTRYTTVRRSGGGTTTTPELMFGLNQKLNLTELTLISLAAPRSNLVNVPLWHLVGTNSTAIKSFYYGQYIRGLNPAVPGSRPQPLTTNVPYRLIIEAGKIKGQHDFTLK